MSNLDNQPDPLWTEVQKGNAQAEVMRKLIQSKFPRTYRLLNGIRFQLPARRQADYPNHEYAADWDGQLLMDGAMFRRPLGIPSITFLREGSTASLCRRTATRMGWGFTFTAGLAQTKNGPSPFTPPVGSNAQTLRALAEAPAQRAADGPYAWNHRADTYLTEAKRSFLKSCCSWGRSPKEYEPDQVLRAAREKKGHLRPELRAARFLGKEAYRPASRPTGADEHQSCVCQVQQKEI